jgi:hypothetical protein
MAATKKKKATAEIKAYRPAEFEGLFDALLGAPIRGIAGALGMPERDAYQYSQRAVNAANDITGLVSAENALRRIGYGRGTASDVVQAAAPAVPFGVGKVAGRIARGLSEAAPAVVRNRMYSEKLLGPEYAAGDTLPSYGFRNVSSPAEVDDIIQSGFMRPTKEGGPKYFTMSDKPHGNPANLTVNKPVLRVDSQNIPKNSPVRAEHVMIWDPVSQRFVSILKKKR